MNIYLSDQFPLPLPEGHRFPISKYMRLRQKVQESASISPANLITASPASDDEILRVHQQSYWDSIVHGTLTAKEMRQIGFPWSPEMVERTRRSVGATLQACRAALQDGLAASLAGGTHHAYPEHGEGYCVLNDAAVASRAMQSEGRAFKLIIIDCDVHQGNGTAAIFAGDPSVFTFSIHAAKNYPFTKETSDLDIELEDNCEDEGYLAALQNGLDQAIPKARADLVIYIAGADPFVGDKLGRLSLTKPGLLARDRMVFERCQDVGLPVAIVMGGGYGRQIDDTVDIHFQTIQLAVEISAQQ